MALDRTSTCQNCGATIYHEHINAGIARYEDGKLLCPHCVEEYESSHDKTGSSAGDIFEPIAVEGGTAPDMTESQIRTFGGGGAMGGGKWDESRFLRPLDPTGKGASRCRIFHSKLNDGAISFMTDQINEWLESIKDITIKSVTSTIGIFEGKHPEPNLILTLFY